MLGMGRGKTSLEALGRAAEALEGTAKRVDERLDRSHELVAEDSRAQVASLKTHLEGQMESRSQDHRKQIESLRASLEKRIEAASEETGAQVESLRADINKPFWRRGRSK